MPARPAAIAGVILGTAVGDALGLPREGLSASRARRRCGVPPLRHALLLGRGLVSDDTDHTCLVGLALLAEPTDPDRFAACLGRHLRWWLASVPAGVGQATLRAGLRLWRGVPPSRSGVASAGNGPAMRAALLGAVLAHEPDRLRAFTEASSRLTHTDPRALEGAWLVAHAAGQAASGPLNPAALLAELRAAIAHPELLTALDHVARHLGRGSTPAELVADLGYGERISGYVVPTVTAALFCWLRYPTDFRAAVEAVIQLGGDADTTGAIVGGLAGAALGDSAIPAPWLAGLAEWPRTVPWMRRLAAALADPATPPPPRVPWLLLLGRNLLFLGIVLAHGLRRLWPW